MSTFSGVVGLESPLGPGIENYRSSPLALKLHAKPPVYKQAW